MADRSKLGGKDMALTMVVVLVVVAALALYNGGFSFGPGSDTSEGPTPTAHVVRGFEHASATMSFPVTVPAALPAAWQANSYTVSDPTLDGPGTLPTVRGGWVTPDDTFIMLVESSGDIDELMVAEIGQSRDTTGHIEAGGARWAVTTGHRTETAWVRRAGGTTLMITGDASDADFTTLANAVSAAQS